MVTQAKMFCALFLWIWSHNPQQFSQNREINYSEFLSNIKHASFLVLLCHLIMGYWFPLLCISENSLGNALVICSKQGTPVIFWQAGERNTACLSSKTLSTQQTKFIQPTAQFLFFLQYLWGGIEFSDMFTNQVRFRIICLKMPSHMLPPLGVIAQWENTAVIMLPSGPEDNKYSVLMGDRCIGNQQMFEHAAPCQPIPSLMLHFPLGHTPILAAGEEPLSISCCMINVSKTMVLLLSYISWYNMGKVVES